MRSRPPAKKAFVGLGQSGIDTDEIQRGHHVSLRRAQAVDLARDPSNRGCLEYSALQRIFCTKSNVVVIRHCNVFRGVVTKYQIAVLYTLYYARVCVYIADKNTD